jgi:NADH-quinone oxidoreductase subunit I
MLQYLKEAGYSLLSIFEGLKVTGSNMRRPETTLQYPERRPDLSPRFRGLPEVNLETCIVCHLCEKTCPTQCIHIEDLVKPAAPAEPGAPKPEKKKEAKVFDINAALCMFCGLCEESCPTKPQKSIVLGHQFEVSKTTRQGLVYGIEGLHVSAPANPPKPVKQRPRE